MSDSTAKRAEKEYDDWRSLWRRRRALCVLLLTVVSAPLVYSLCSIPSLTRERDALVAKNAELELKVAPFYAVIGGQAFSPTNLQRITTVGVDIERVVAGVERLTANPVLRAALIGTSNTISSTGTQGRVYRREAYAALDATNFTKAIESLTLARQCEPTAARNTLLEAAIYDDMWQMFGGPSYCRNSAALVTEAWYKTADTSYRISAEHFRTSNVDVYVSTVSRHAVLTARRAFRLGLTREQRIAAVAMMTSATSMVGSLRASYPTDTVANAYQLWVGKFERDLRDVIADDEGDERLNP